MDINEEGWRGHKGLEAQRGVDPTGRLYRRLKRVGLPLIPRNITLTNTYTRLERLYSKSTTPLYRPLKALSKPSSTKLK